MSRRLRVLVAEDEPSMQTAIGGELEECAVVIVGCCEEAVPLLVARRFDAVVADLQLGCGPDGVALLAEAARLQPDCGRVLISAFAAPSTIERALESGAAHLFIAKPFRAGELGAAIREAIALGRALRAG